MKVFISWSGDKSQKVALAFKDWLPYVIQEGLELFVSSEDIEKGETWSPKVEERLAESTFGIVCLTKENIYKPWINFESGALYKKVGRKTYVAPFLLDIDKTEVEGPLHQFQLTTFDKKDIEKLVKSLNKAKKECGESSVSAKVLERSFKNEYEELETSLNKIIDDFKDNSESDIPEERQEDNASHVMAELMEVDQQLLDTNKDLLEKISQEHTDHSEKTVINDNMIQSGQEAMIKLLNDNQNFLEKLDQNQRCLEKLLEGQGTEGCKFSDSYIASMREILALSRKNQELLSENQRLLNNLSLRNLTKEDTSSDTMEQILQLTNDNRDLLRNLNEKVAHTSDTGADRNLSELEERFDRTLDRFSETIDNGVSNRLKTYTDAFKRDLFQNILPHSQVQYSFLIVLSMIQDIYPWLYDTGKEMLNILSSGKDVAIKRKSIDDFKTIMNVSFEHTLLDEYISETGNQEFLSSLQNSLKGLLEELKKEYGLERVRTSR